MAEECVVGIFESAVKAQEAVHILDRADYPRSQISLVSAGLDDRPDLVAELKLGDDSVRNSALGAGLGGAAGLLVGMSLVAVPGGGAVFVLGALSIGMMGTVVGAFLGGLGGWGVHESHIRHYEREVKRGRVLLICHGNPLDLANAELILKETDVLEVCVHAETGDDAAEVEDLLRPASLTVTTAIPVGSVPAPMGTEKLRFAEK